MLEHRPPLEAKFKEAFSLHRQGRLAEASVLYEELLCADPDHFKSLHLLGVASAETDELERAEALIGRAIALQPADPTALCNYANVLRALERYDEALYHYGRALRVDPDHADTHFNRGVALTELQRHEVALLDFERATSLRPKEPAAYFGLAQSLRSLGRFDMAAACLDRLISFRPDDADAYTLRGIVVTEGGRHAEGLENLSRAVEIAPARPDYHNNLGRLLLLRGQLERARDSFERAISLEPAFVDAHFNLGLVHAHLGQPTHALERYDRVIALVPDHAGAHHHRGLALRKQRDQAAALAALTRAVEIDPGSADIHRSLGLLAFDRERYPEALTHFDAAIQRQPLLAEAWYGRANVLVELKRYQDAVASYDQALALNPDYRFVRGLRVHAKLLGAQWTHLDTDIAELTLRAARLEPVAPPFDALLCVDSPGLHRKLAETWVEEECRANPELGAIPGRDRRDKLRVGYFSADFHNHATMELLAEVLELHDRSRFELTAFSFGPDSSGPERARLAAACEGVIDVRSSSDREIAALSRSLEIDIAVDLKGFTQGSRPGIFASRAAPIQVSYLGFPGTLGAPYIDYLIADPTVIPPSQRQHYMERIVYLPHCYQPNDSRRPIADTSYTRKSLALPESGFVFCCFNNHCKILPAVFDVWMRLLERVQGSVLWLLGDNPDAARNLRHEARLRGIDPARLVFAPQMALPQHLARHRCADLFLDTTPYNAHTTASDALWAGLPLLTCPGEAFAGRVAASLLRAVGLPQLIAKDAAEYEARAIELATHPTRLAELRQALAARRHTAPLFDSARYTRHLERAFLAMDDAYRCGRKPEDLTL